MLYAPAILLLRSVRTDAHGLPAIPTSVTEHLLGSEQSIFPWQLPDDLQLDEILGA